MSEALKLIPYQKYETCEQCNDHGETRTGLCVACKDHTTFCSKCGESACCNAGTVRELL